MIVFDGPLYKSLDSAVVLDSFTELSMIDPNVYTLSNGNTFILQNGSIFVFNEVTD